MKNIIFILLGIIGVCLIIWVINRDSTPQQSDQFKVPEAKGYVNDYAEILSPETEAILESELKTFKPEIAILTIKDLSGLSIEEYGIKVAEAWKVGDADKDDGIVLIISTNDRKVRIEVGYGSEGKINDAKAGRILDENIIPNFKNGDWESGILEGVLSIKAALK